MIPLFKPYISKDCIKELEKVLMSGYIGEGHQVKKFEAVLSDYFGSYVVLVNSCTAALHLALHITGVRDKKVITTPMTCLATNTPILQNGGIVVWADVEEETGNIDIESVKEKLTWDTAAVVCTHYGGNICDMELLKLCQSKGVALIEDCAHLTDCGLGGLQCYSFQAIKHLTTGDGGALVTSNKKIYERAKLLRWYGLNREAGETMRYMNPVYEAGYKFHMNNINATIGLANFEKLDSVMNTTREHADFYNEEFANLTTIKPVPVKYHNDYWLYILLVENRDDFMSFMRIKGVETSLVHARNDPHPIFDDSKCELPGLEKFWVKQVCIPAGWWLSEKETRHIANVVKEYDKICVSASRK